MTNAIALICEISTFVFGFCLEYKAGKAVTRNDQTKQHTDGCDC